MREILFRGKSISSNDWIYGSLVQLTCECNNVKIFPINSKSVHDSVSIDLKSIGQFTGLIDKNGKQIFEGDVLKIPVRRLSSSNWWQKTNQNHGFVGDFVYKVIEFNISDDSSGFEFCDAPITRRQIESIARPRGKERCNQTVDDINFKANECEIVGNVFDNLELVAA